MGRQLLIVGMHRSGTSLTASVLRQAGLDLGQHLIGARRSNPRGHFEDWEFHQLHERMLAAAGRTAFTAEGDLTALLGATFLEQADALIASRDGLALWGWKNPRTCLFLEFWENLLPAANYVFVYRHPADVALSLLRRDADPEPRKDPWVAIRTWEMYNRLLLDFRDRHPDRCFLAQLPALALDLPGFVRQVTARLGLPLQAEGVGSLFVPTQLTRTLESGTAAWQRLMPVAMQLYRRLGESADLPSRPDDVDATAGARGGERQQQDANAKWLCSLLEGRAQGRGRPERPPAGVVDVAGAHPARPTLPLAVAELEPPRAKLKGAEPTSPTTLEAALADERRRRKVLRLEYSHALDQLENSLVHIDRLTHALNAIEGSRSFALVRAWWCLRLYLRGRFSRRRPLAVTTSKGSS